MQQLVDLAFYFGRRDRHLADVGAPIWMNPFQDAPHEVRMAWLAGFNFR